MVNWNSHLVHKRCVSWRCGRIVQFHNPKVLLFYLETKKQCTVHQETIYNSISTDVNFRWSQFKHMPSHFIAWHDFVLLWIMNMLLNVEGSIMIEDMCMTFLLRTSLVWPTNRRSSFNNTSIIYFQYFLIRTCNNSLGENKKRHLLTEGVDTCAGAICTWRTFQNNNCFRYNGKVVTSTFTNTIMFLIPETLQFRLSLLPTLPLFKIFLISTMSPLSPSRILCSSCFHSMLSFSTQVCIFCLCSHHWKFLDHYINAH